MKLEKIGFYTMSDNRAKNVSIDSPIYRAEFIITDKCNFKCPYCRGVNKTELSFNEFKNQLDLLNNSGGIINIRLSGGEPTLNKELEKMVSYARSIPAIQHIAISTNGSANIGTYRKLISSGVNDFSISFDACCSVDCDTLSGRVGYWNKIKANIASISKLCYVSVGTVINETNEAKIKDVVLEADRLGVRDIRIIPSAQYNKSSMFSLPDRIINKHPILKYRMENMGDNISFRGLSGNDSQLCPLVIDDLAILNGEHYPCIIYMREKGNPIGELNRGFRGTRHKWFLQHNCKKDKICLNNCLDVCRDYNRVATREYIEKRATIPLLGADSFNWLDWLAKDLFDFKWRTNSIIQHKGDLNKFALGWIWGNDLFCRPKQDNIAVLFEKNGDRFWSHLWVSEFVQTFIKESGNGHN